MIFHLAAIVSAEAEADFDKGYRINLDGTRRLFDAVRKIGDGYRPRLVFTSSIAVFGAPFPDAIGDEFFFTPLTSYGTQKAIGELLLADYSRRGFFDGIGIRLPTICVRPGKPNKAASGFFSSIIREPLDGRGGGAAGRRGRAPLARLAALGGGFPHPCRDDRHGPARGPAQPQHAGPVSDGRRADRGARRVAGDKVVDRIRREPDPVIIKIVEGWPRKLDASRAESLGFKAEKSFDDIIRAHIEDELGGKWAA